MILVIDNFDSFTYNLVNYLGQCGVETRVIRNNAIDLDQIRAMRPAGIMLSPGPCTPDQSGVCLPILNAALGDDPILASTPIFGVCLGHQAIGLMNGGQVGAAKSIRHGKTSLVQHDGLGVFHGMPNPFQAIRYHSLAILPGHVPTGFVVTATSEDGEVMGVRHESLPIEGVQFHPESILTENGIQIVRNFADRCSLTSA